MAISIPITEAIDILKDKIKLVRIATNGEHVFKCPFCGDSDNPHHAHMYVNPNMGIFNCYKCEMSGSIGRILYLFEGNKYSISGMDKAYKKKSIGSITEKLVSNKTDFEKYIYEYQQKILFNDYFNIIKTIETHPLYLIKHQYMMDRVIKDKKILPFLNKTNLTQHLFTYYSEYFMNKIIECDGVNLKTHGFIHSNILDRHTSILFNGYNKTLGLFKNDSRDIKYFKTKCNVLYGDTKPWDFFMIINQNKFTNSLTDIYKQPHLDVYFAEGVFDAINLYLYNPEYVTGVKPDIILATGSKVSYGSALYFVRDTFMKPIVSHLFLDPEIRYKSFIKKYRFMRRIYRKCIAYQNGKYDYGEIKKDDLKDIQICSIVE